MINSESVARICTEYVECCIQNGEHPTFSGMGKRLGVSGNTIRHIVTGFYKWNQAYTDKPHASRCVRNDDFIVIRSVFERAKRYQNGSTKMRVIY